MGKDRAEDFRPVNVRAGKESIYSLLQGGFFPSLEKEPHYRDFEHHLYDNFPIQK